MSSRPSAVPGRTPLLPRADRLLRLVKTRVQALRRHPLVSVSEAFLSHLGEQLRRDAALKNAASLAYATLLALVPLLTIGFSVLAAFPVFEDTTDRLREALFANLVPATGEAIEEHLERFMERATGLTAIGIVGLTATALLLMNTVERVLNEIWHVRRPRPMLQRFMLYWTVLTLGPLLLGASVAATSSLAGATFFGEVDVDAGGTPVLSGILLPFFMQATAFTLLYALVPYRTVPLASAVTGGVVASAAFETAKLGFAWFVAWVPTYEAIYGALAALPLFLIWLYISWLIFLLGAEITRSIRGFRRRWPDEEDGRGAELILTVHVLGHLYRAQREGQGLHGETLLRLEPDAGELALERVLEMLRAAGVVQRAADGRWFLACDLGRLTLAELHRRHAFALPSPAALADGEGPGDQRLAEVLEPVDGKIRGAFGVPLETFFRDEAGGAAGRGGE